jgi:hypothetical protein
MPGKISRPTNRHAKPVRADLTPIHAKRAADFWCEVFISVLELYAGDEGQIEPEIAAKRARSLADFALEQFEDRWQGVRL